MFWVVFSVISLQKNKSKKKPGKTRRGWCMSNAVSNVHVQLRNIGRCVADLPFRRGIGSPSSYTYKRVSTHSVGLEPAKLTLLNTR